MVGEITVSMIRDLVGKRELSFVIVCKGKKGADGGGVPKE